MQISTMAIGSTLVILLCILCLTEGKAKIDLDIPNEDLMKTYDKVSSQLGQLGTRCKGSDWSTCTTKYNEETSCHDVYKFCNSVMESLFTTSVTVSNSSSNNTGITQAQAFIYGTALSLGVSLLSLLGLLIVPLVISKTVIIQIIYKYTMTLLIAMGTSALLCDALFELLPTVLHIDHGHGSHLHDEDDEDSKDYVWKICAIISGVFIFYLFELVLHHVIQSAKIRNQRQLCKTNQDRVPLIENEDNTVVRVPNYDETCFQKLFAFRRVKPLAWIILTGDILHNIADGITIGASISQSLTLGLSTTFAIVLHEIPHELADFAILLKSGMHWCTALLFNVMSSLAAIIGFFIGVAISTSSNDSKEWLLAIAAGSFLYISLADLLPELRTTISHSHGPPETDSEQVHVNSFTGHVINIVVIVTGFVISFVFLLLLTLNEDKLDDIF